MSDKKAFRPKKPSARLERAQYRLDRAVVRGEGKELVDQLRAIRDAIAEDEK